jgi:hypothetical protein
LPGRLMAETGAVGRRCVREPARRLKSRCSEAHPAEFVGRSWKFRSTYRSYSDFGASKTWIESPTRRAGGLHPGGHRRTVADWRPEAPSSREVVRSLGFSV